MANTAHNEVEDLYNLLRMVNRVFSQPRPRRPAPPPGMRWVTKAEAERIAKDKAEAQALKAVAVVVDADTELRTELIEVMVKDYGFSAHVAANLTNTRAKLLEQAKFYKLI